MTIKKSFISPVIYRGSSADKLVARGLWHSVRTLGILLLINYLPDPYNPTQPNQSIQSLNGNNLSVDVHLTSSFHFSPFVCFPFIHSFIHPSHQYTHPIYPFILCLSYVPLLLLFHFSTPIFFKKKSHFL